MTLKQQQRYKTSDETCHACIMKGKDNSCDGSDSINGNITDGFSGGERQGCHVGFTDALFVIIAAGLLGVKPGLMGLMKGCSTLVILQR